MLEVFVCFLLMMAGAAAFLAVYRLGLQDGGRMAKGKAVFYGRGAGSPLPMTEKEKRMQTIFDNLDAYDGTDKGQVKV
jgi:hypothetical protein